jgi:hypothetical protein
MEDKETPDARALVETQLWLDQNADQPQTRKQAGYCSYTLHKRLFYFINSQIAEVTY